MKLSALGSSAIGSHGMPSDFCQEWARLKACPISWQAVQKRLRAIQAAGLGSPAGASLMKESLNMAVPCRRSGPISSNMMPQRSLPDSCCAADRTHIAHGALLEKRDQ